jgi:phenylpropionate dioxygenase-like ring-hydroxylating dioxygenase large terminal subunit
MWRSDDVVCVADAHCPHLGAHLGYGGTVDEQGCLRCPFHGWLWRSDGRCEVVPYSSHVNRKAALRLYPARECSDGIFVWHDPSGAPPTWPIESVSFPDSGSTRVALFERTVKTNWQEMGENVVDIAHLAALHHTPPPRSYVVEDEGAVRTVTFDQPYRTIAGEGDACVVSTGYGPAIGVVRYSGLIDVTMVSTVTPVDSERVNVRFAFFGKVGDAPRSLSWRISRLFAREVVRQIEQDIVIWEHKAYAPVPCLVPEDGPIMEWRGWARQFYP